MRFRLLKPLAFVSLLLLATWAPAAVDLPKAVDDRLVIELFVAEPDIVTPTGIAVDETGAVILIESNTHFPPQNYPGRKSDRIVRFEDTDGDGRADRSTTLLEGTAGR